jgi:hypothetical protein
MFVFVQFGEGAHASEMPRLHSERSPFWYTVFLSAWCLAKQWTVLLHAGDEEEHGASATTKRTTKEVVPGKRRVGRGGKN